jgi:transcription elongation GreA/GreB family factor
MAAGTRLQQNALRVQVISPQAPLGQALLGLQEGDEVSLQREGTPRYWQVVAVC